MAGKKQEKAEKHPKLLDFEELLLISSVPAQDPREKALEKEHHGERFNPSNKDIILLARSINACGLPLLKAFRMELSIEKEKVTLRG